MPESAARFRHLSGKQVYNGAMSVPLPAFRLGDVRGIYPDELDEAFATRFAHAFTGHFRLQGTVATGRDMRASSENLQSALNDGLRACGIQVMNLGLCATELGYFASTRPDIDAAIVVTASHNPEDYNGFKCVLKNGEAVTFETGLNGVMRLMLDGHRNPGSGGSITAVDLLPGYIDHVRSHFDIEQLNGGHVALNGLNGTATTLAAALASEFHIPVSWFRQDPGPIPMEGADPARPRLVRQMNEFMKDGNFMAGVSWDGDCDRCVFFGSEGRMIPTYYIVGLLAQDFLIRSPAAAIVFDTKLCWNTLEIIDRLGGIAIPSETGHAFMKKHMRRSGAIYGGELSSHHYFGDFFGCDSGMFAWLNVISLIHRAGLDLEDMISDRRERFCCTPEISLGLTDVDAAFEQIISEYGPGAKQVEHFDGIGLHLPEDWRVTLRRSKTEPLLRINFESLGHPDRLLGHAYDLLEHLAPYRCDEADLDLRIQ